MRSKKSGNFCHPKIHFSPWVQLTFQGKPILKLLRKTPRINFLVAVIKYLRILVISTRRLLGVYLGLQFEGHSSYGQGGIPRSMRQLLCCIYSQEAERERDERSLLALRSVSPNFFLKFGITDQRAAECTFDVIHCILVTLIQKTPHRQVPELCFFCFSDDSKSNTQDQPPQNCSYLFIEK